MKTEGNRTKETTLKVILTLLIILSICFNVYMFWLVRNQNLALVSEIDTYSKALSINQLKLTSTTEEKKKVADNLLKEKENSTIFANQIQSLAGTVGVLEKLSKTDSELLKKYSKVYFLNENYIPPKLATIPEQYIYEKNKKIEIHEQVWPHLQTMLESAKADGVEILIASGYRSFGTQAGLKSTYKVIYGAGTANKFSADQGYSEHQLGTTLDFTTKEIGGNLVGFEKTKAFEWLTNNSHKYGFIMSYPKNNTYYVYEPWHYRFVSIPLATSLRNDGLHFYDLEQRVIDQYLINFFE
jgi:LAS superfamily LD-carboxypeptidase LdcB